MRILMTQRELSNVAGSEMVTVEVAKTLASRGHEIAVYSPKIGDVAKLLLPSGVKVLRELRDAPWTPDLIHGQHHLTAMAAIARFPTSSAIYYCHGTQPWVEKPPLHSRIGRYVMMCEWMVIRAQAELGLAPERVTFIPNFVNTTRFSEVRRAPAQIRNALLFGGSRLPESELLQLEVACAALGIKLDKIGHAYENHRSRPEVFLQQYDLVFAIGKCALEAMATGCAVIPVIPGQAGALVTTDTFDEWAFSNFGPRYFMLSSQINEQWLRQQIDRYSPSDLERVTTKVRVGRTIDVAVNRLEAIYREVAQAQPAAFVADDSFAPYLEQLANDVDPMWAELEGIHGKLKKMAEMKAKLRESTRAQEHQQAELLALYRKLHGDHLPRPLRYRELLYRMWTRLRAQWSRKRLRHVIPAE